MRIDSRLDYIVEYLLGFQLQSMILESYIGKYGFLVLDLYDFKLSNLNS